MYMYVNALHIMVRWPTAWHAERGRGDNGNGRGGCTIAGHLERIDPSPIFL